MNDKQVMEKVKLVEDLIASFSTGVRPSDEQLRRAEALGIDVKELEDAYEVPPNF